MAERATLLSETSFWEYFLHKSLSINNTEINDTDEYGHAHLHFVAFIGKTGPCREYLSLGADVNSIDHLGNTPLFYACFKGHANIVQLLLENGADIRVKNNAGFAALDYAMMVGRSDENREKIIDLFREYAPDMVLERFCIMDQQKYLPH